MSVPYIHTAVRVRVPVNPAEDVWTRAIPEYGLIDMGGTFVRYNVGFLFPDLYTQEMIFESAAKPLLEKFIRGEQNITFLAFGPKSGGKSYTLFGPGAQLTASALSYGIYSRLASFIFSRYDAPVISEKQVTIEVSFFVIDGSKIIDLLNNSEESRELFGNQTDDNIAGLNFEKCYSARHMLDCLNYAFVNKTACKINSHMFAKVVLTQPFLGGGVYNTVTTSALFIECANTLVRVPVTNANTSSIACIEEDQYILNSLVHSAGGRLNTPQPMPELSPLYQLLRSSFNGDRATLAFCCIPPNCRQATESSSYLYILNNIVSMRLSLMQGNYQGNYDDQRNKNVASVNTNSLISEAESLLSKLSVSQSITDEDQEKLKNWLAMKKECEDDSHNQSHGHLECIEEVTESEEDIASSDEKMSESPISLDNSIYESDQESDQEEGDSKVQLSDQSFVTSLDTMCFKFNAFVDNFVDSFKTRTSVEAGQHRKPCSTARRGGMPEIPKVNELPVHSDTTSTNANPNTQTNTRTNLGGCIRKVPGVSVPLPKERKSRIVDEKENAKGATANAQSAKENFPCGFKSMNEKYGIRKTPQVHEDQDMFNILKDMEEDIKTIKTAWARFINQLSQLKFQGKVQQMKELQEKKHRAMILSVTGINPLMGMMKEALGIKQYSAEELPGGFSHFIRNHRYSKNDFMAHKSRLDSKIKDKTATEFEVRDYIIADEMIETLDSAIEILNHYDRSRIPYNVKLEETPVARDWLDKMNTMTNLEMRHLMFKYFLKVVDLRDNSKVMEKTIAEYEQKLEGAQVKIKNLSRFLHEMRTQTTERQAMMQYRTGEGAYGGAPTSPLALTEGAKSKRVTTSIPQQNLNKLQVNKAAPPHKVTFKHNKLIIEKPDNQN